MKLLLLAFIFTLAMAVKRSNFRTSGTSSFGRRNRYLARHSALTKTEGLRFDMNYKIDKETLEYADSLLKFEVKSVFEEQNWFVGEVSFYENGVIEFFMDEKSPIYPRYKIPPGDAIDTSCLTKLTRQDAVKLEENRTVFELGDSRYEIYYEPFKVLGFFKGHQTVSVNERSLMNFERYRERGFLMQPKNQTFAPPAAVPIIDATGLLMEKDGEYVELPELWEERFKEFTDSKPRGPSSVGIDVFFPDAGNVYGIPEHADSLSLQDTWESEPYRLYNLDVFEYDLNERMALYGSIPFLLSSQPDRSAGFYWNNPSETYIDIKSEDTSKFTHWFSEAGVIHFFIIQAETPLEVVQLFTLMSGPPQLPQYFALGYHQCRWNYLDQQDLLGVMEGFETHDIPVDVLWLDIEHTQDKMYFTWDYRKFPTPTDMQDQLALKGRKLVNIVDPHIKREESYFLHKEASQGLYVKNEDGNDFQGHCWPGNSSWLDYIRPEVRKYWSERFLYTNYKDSTPALYIWNDMNEPSVFSGPEITMPKTNIHAGMFEHRELHNIYGTYFHRSTFEGLLLRSSSNDRPFVLSRAFFTGASKYGAVWSGDNAAKWEYLDYSLPMALSMAVAGISFNGADVGGFFLNPSPELLVRWYQVGIFLPFFRAHAHIETKRREPWLFGEPTLSYIRKAIYDRYRLIPHFYTLFYHYSTAGLPVIRPMFVEFYNDPECAKLDRQFMLGGELLVKSIPEDKVDRINVYLPEGRWYDYWTYQDIQSGWQAVKTNPDSIPVFIRGGAVIMRKDRVRRSTQFTVNDPYSIIIALDSQGKAEGTLYVDDGRSFNYKSGEFLLAKISCKDNECVWEVISDSFFSNSIERITILGLPSTAKIQLVSQSLKQEADFYADEHSMVIRKPGVHINQNWSLVIS